MATNEPSARLIDNWFPTKPTKVGCLPNSEASEIQILLALFEGFLCYIITIIDLPVSIMVRPNKLLSTKITDGYRYTVNLESCKAANIFDSVFHLRESTMEPNLPKHFEKCECKNSF